MGKPVNDNHADQREYLVGRVLARGAVSEQRLMNDVVRFLEANGAPLPVLHHVADAVTAVNALIVEGEKDVTATARQLVPQGLANRLAESLLEVLELVPAGPTADRAMGALADYRAAVQQTGPYRQPPRGQEPELEPEM